MSTLYTSNSMKSSTSAVCFCSVVLLTLSTGCMTSPHPDLMAMVVCDTTNLECMVHHCKNCPGYPALDNFIRNKYAELEIDEEMSCSQWESIDRTKLWTRTADVDNFIKLLVYSVDNFTAHSFIAKSQAQHLKQKKEEITDIVYHSLGLCSKL